MNINERMAIEVMGWEKDLLGQVRWIMSRNKDRGYIDEYMLLSEWHPDTDIGQAMMCAEKSGLEMHIHIGDYHGIPYVVEEYSKEFDRSCNTIEEVSLAICEAILEAME